jgi:hypothetical protein
MSDNSILKYYFDLKQQSQDIDQKIKEIESSATEQALNIISQTDNYKQVAFQNENGRIVVAFKNQFCKVEDSSILIDLEKQIHEEMRLLAEKSHQKLIHILSAIEHLKGEIKLLEDEQSLLMSSEKLTKLQEMFKLKFEELSYKIPQLRVTLN